MQSSKIDRIKDLVEQLNAASESYYAKDQEIMSNYEYDKLYDELVEVCGCVGCCLSFCDKLVLYHERGTGSIQYGSGSESPVGQTSEHFVHSGRQ